MKWLELLIHTLILTAGVAIMLWLLHQLEA